MAQVKLDLAAEDCTELFRDYEINDYIKNCYEEYHVQGDVQMGELRQNGKV